MARNNLVVSEGLSFHNESKKMVQLLGSLCRHMIKADDRAMIHASWAWSAVALTIGLTLVFNKQHYWSPWPNPIANTVLTKPDSK